MCIREEIAQPGIAKHLVHIGSITAFGEPNALRPTAKMPLELAAALLDLGVYGIAVDRHQRQKAVRRAAGDDLQLADLKEATKAVDKVVAVLLHEHIACPREAMVIHVGEMMEFRLPARSLNFLTRQGN